MLDKFTEKLRKDLDDAVDHLLETDEGEEIVAELARRFARINAAEAVSADKSCGNDNESNK